MKAAGLGAGDFLPKTPPGGEPRALGSGGWALVTALCRLHGRSGWVTQHHTVSQRPNPTATDVALLPASVQDIAHRAIPNTLGKNTTHFWICFYF